MREMLAALPAELVEGWSVACISRLSALDEWRRASALHTYVGSLPGEVRTERLVELALEERKAVICPRIRPHGQLEHHEVTSLSQLAESSFGLREPDPELCPPANAQLAELVVVPGVAFTVDGSRLGMGGGYYDRFLSAHSAVRVGLAYEMQIAESMPQSAHDQAVDVIVTELRVIRCR